MLIPGRCHCGNIAFELRWEPEPAEIPVRACACSFCLKHGGVWAANPQASLRAWIHEPAQAQAYTFETGTAEFHLCRRCGVVPLVTSRIDGRLYAVVSANAFEGVDPARLKHAKVSFEGEETGARLQRRARHWIGDVRIEHGGGAE